VLGDSLDDSRCYHSTVQNSRTPGYHTVRARTAMRAVASSRRAPPGTISWRGGQAMVSELRRRIGKGQPMAHPVKPHFGLWRFPSPFALLPVAKRSTLPGRGPTPPPPLLDNSVRP
jgi:hypothetical protein